MHRSSFRFKYIFILFVAGLLLSCDAYRDNPLDPSSPDNIYLNINGKVKTESIPRQPISNVEVFWTASNIVVKTDYKGEFSIRDINKENEWIYFGKPGYSSDSIYVEWGDRKSVDLEVFLNANPVLDSIIVSSKVVNSFPDRQTYYCDISAKITDDEFDIDTVFVWNPGINFMSPLSYNPSTKFFLNSYSEEDLNITSVEDLIGTEFHIMVKDKSGKIFDTGDEILKRIINQEIEFESPKNNFITSNPVLLVWRRFLPGFNFNYKIEIFSSDLPPVLVWEMDDIPESAINFTVTENLPAGEYYWVIWGTDEYFNTTRSKPASFIVE